jgi:nucleotide-binding universal stress UspA family protein
LREGAKLAQLCDAEVFLLAVVEPSFGATLEGGVMIPMDEQIATYEAILAEGAKRLKAMGFSPTARLGMGAAGQEIAGVAEEIGANLVVVGHRPTGPLLPTSTFKDRAIRSSETPFSIAFKIILCS